jgi:hypothetical protein
MESKSSDTIAEREREDCATKRDAADPKTKKEACMWSKGEGKGEER